MDKRTPREIAERFVEREVRFGRIFGEHRANLAAKLTMIMMIQERDHRREIATLADGYEAVRNELSALRGEKKEDAVNNEGFGPIFDMIGQGKRVRLTNKTTGAVFEGVMDHHGGMRVRVMLDGTSKYNVFLANEWKFEEIIEPAPDGYWKRGVYVYRKSGDDVTGVNLSHYGNRTFEANTARIRMSKGRVEAEREGYIYIGEL